MFIMIFSRIEAIIGAIFFAVGMLLTVLFGSMADFRSLEFDSGEPATALAKITSTEVTNAQENDRDVIQYLYSYKIAGKEMQGDSYSSESDFTEGDEVSIQYLPASPEISRIVGMNNNYFPIWVFGFVLIFPLVGLGLMAFTYNKIAGYMRILAQGVTAKANQLEVQRTNVRVNGRAQYKLVYSYKVSGQDYQHQCRDTHPDIFEKTETIVYDGNNPQKAVLVKSLPNKLQQQVHV